jgi:hypothetical protein
MERKNNGKLLGKILPIGPGGTIVIAIANCNSKERIHCTVQRMISKCAKNPPRWQLQQEWIINVANPAYNSTPVTPASSFVGGAENRYNVFLAREGGVSSQNRAVGKESGAGIGAIVHRDCRARDCRDSSSSANDPMKKWRRHGESKLCKKKENDGVYATEAEIRHFIERMRGYPHI